MKQFCPMLTTFTIFITMTRLSGQISQKNSGSLPKYDPIFPVILNISLIVVQNLLDCKMQMLAARVWSCPGLLLRSCKGQGLFINNLQATARWEAAGTSPVYDYDIVCHVLVGTPGPWKDVTKCLDKPR